MRAPLGSGWSRAAAATLIGLVLPAATARAQTASQITPPSFSPTIQSFGGGLSIPDGVGLQAPEGAERLSVRVRTVRVEGATGALAAESAALVARLSNRTVTAAEIFAAARALEQASSTGATSASS